MYNLNIKATVKNSTLSLFNASMAYIEQRRHISLMLSQGNVEWHYPLSLHNGLSSVPYPKGCKEGSIKHLSVAFRQPNQRL